MAAALVVAALVCYVVVRRELRGQVDDSLKAQAARIAGGDLQALGDQGIPAPSPSAGGPAQYWQVVAAGGDVIGSLGGLRLPWNRTVEARLLQAINNLLDNAARHSPRGEVVQISLSQDGLRVRDHGPGIDQADLPHIFDRFYRGTSSRGQPGSRLGLAIVQRIIEQHHGAINATNAPDGGAIFTITLPHERRTEPPHSPPAA